MNKTLNNDNSKPPRRIDTAGCRSSLKDGSTINKEEAKRNRKERRDGPSRRVLSTLCPCWTALATVRPGHATELAALRATCDILIDQASVGRRWDAAFQYFYHRFLLHLPSNFLGRL